MSSTYIKLPIESGGGGGAVDSFNGRTGIVIPLAGDYTASEVTNVPAGDIIATNVQDAINELDFEKQNSITGSNNQVVYKNGSGDIETLSSLNVTPQLGLNQNINDAIEDASSHAVNYDYLGIDPTENSPDTQVTYKNVEVELDPDNTGFDIGSNGNAATVYNNFIKHEGTSDSGSITFTNNNFTLGNGTDAITVDGLSYSFGFGEIKNNVTLNGALQGYGFQPNIRTGAIVDQTNSYTTAFYDNTNYEGDSSYHTSFNSGPTIDNIPSTKGFTGLTVNPTVPNISANAGITGVAISGIMGTFGNNSYFNGLNVNPTITSARYAAGIDVSMDNVTPYAGAQSTLTEQDLTFTFVAAGDNNGYTMEYTGGGTAGSENVSILGQAVTVQIEDGVSTATQIKNALDANLGFVGAVTTTISGVGSNPQNIFGPDNFINGEQPGQVLAARLDGNVEISGSLSFGGALSIGQLNAFATQAVVSGSGNPASIHNLISSPTVGDSETITLGDTIGVNTAMLLTVGTGSTVTTGLVGLSALALPAVVTIGSGSSVDQIAGATFAVSLSGSPGAGTIAQMDLCRSVALPDGNTTVTRMAGFKFDLPFGDPGTTTWGFYESPGSHNYLQGDLLIGGTAGSDDVVTNSSVALEIKSVTKAFVPSRMTTTERDAMTPIAGMVIFNLTVSKHQGHDGTTWNDFY